MNNKRKELIIKILFCTAISLLLLTCIDFNTYYIGHDGLFHINRLEGIVKAFEDKQFLTKIYPYTNNGYGYAVSLFYCDILLYPFALIYKIGVPLITSYVIMIIFYSSFSIFAMMWSSSKIFSKNKIAPYIATLLFALCNYRLLDTYVRNALGEVFAICFVPFVFYALYSIFIKKEDAWIWLGVSYGGLAISHNISLLVYGVYFAIIFIVDVFLEKDKTVLIKIIKTSAKGAILAVLLSSFYLIPLVEQTTSQEFLCTKYFVDEYNLASTSLSLQEIFSIFFINSSLNSGPNLGPIITILPLFYFFQKNKNKYITSLIVIYVLSFLYLLGLIPILYKIKFFNIMQFSWRIFIFLFPLAVLLSTYVLININKKSMYSVIAILLVTFTISQCRYHVYLDKHINRPKKLIKYNISHEELYDPSTLEDSFYYNFYEMYSGEYLPPTESYDYLKESTYIKRIEGNDFDEVKDKNGDYLQYERRGTNIAFDYDSNEDELLMVPLTYYKGYSVYCDKEKIDINSTNKYKQVAFKTIPGNHVYTVHYDGTIVQHVTLAISFISLLYVIVISIRRNRLKR